MLLIKPLHSQEHHLALRSEGVKMVVDSMQPHFVGVDPDILSTGLVFYYLKVGFGWYHYQLGKGVMLVEKDAFNNLH